MCAKAKKNISCEWQSVRKMECVLKWVIASGLIFLWTASRIICASSSYPHPVEPGAGKWELMVQNGGVSAMHMTTTHLNTVIMFDRTDFGPSKLLLDNERCRDDPRDLVLKHDCWAHSIEYDIAKNSIRPLMIMSDTWCSSGAFSANGTLVHTGGYNDGEKSIRYFSPCIASNTSSCDWIESKHQRLSENRWYASNQILADGTIIVVGGRRAFSFEFVPKRSSGEGRYKLPFLRRTYSRRVENNLYPFLHLSSDGNLFIFANKDSILFDYKKNIVVRRFPTMPGGARNYPSSGSSVMLPLNAKDSFHRVEIMICGGAPDDGFTSANSGNFMDALDSCGRIVITDKNPCWSMEAMPAPRVMGDMLILPNGEILIINGAHKGTAGWEFATNPALSPCLYKPTANATAGDRFSLMAPSTIPRLYHSTANMLPDGRILVGGSNPHVDYRFSGQIFPTELRLEAYSPYYLNSCYRNMRPVITSVVPASSIGYGSNFKVGFYVQWNGSIRVEFNMYAPPFTTHAYSMNQRMLKLAANSSLVEECSGRYIYIAYVTAPPTPVAAPPGFYMLFVVNHGIPSVAHWIRVS